MSHALDSWGSVIAWLEPGLDLQLFLSIPNPGLDAVLKDKYMF